MNILKHLLVLSAFSIVAFGSCRKDADQTFYMKDDFKSHFDYSTASNWILYDSVSGSLDTITCDKNERYMYTSDGLTYVHLECSKFDFTERINKKVIIWECSISSQSTFNISSYQMNSPVVALLYNWPSPISDNQHSFLDSFTDMGHTYYNVYRTQAIKPGQLNIDIYFNADKGFIKMDLSGGDSPTRSLHLLTSHIVI